MSNRYERTLAQLFKHPISMNIKWKDILHMLEAYGAELEVVHGGREKVKLGDVEKTFHIPHGKHLDNRDEIVELRHFLERAGIHPSED